MKFAIIVPAIVSGKYFLLLCLPTDDPMASSFLSLAGAFTERVAFGPYCMFVILFTLFIYCPLAHWAWHPDGFLKKWGVLDFAGGIPIETASGWAALSG